MNKRKRADNRGNGIGSKTNDYLGDNHNMLSKQHYRRNRPETQCVGCGTDYLRFAVKGYCQWCQQQVEFILRERPGFRGGLANDV